MALSAGTRLGPYEILEPLGAGGMGEVYRARDTRLDRTVAVKALPAHLSASPKLRQRLEREAKVVSSLSHPHICTLHDIGREGEADFLVMEYLEGETLADRLRKGQIPLDQALRYASEIADALDTAHRHGVIHRDLKPGNVMLTKSGAKLLDFGLAKLRETGTDEDLESVSRMPTQARPLTEEGQIVGTYPYMAPEQLEGKAVDARTDLFAFGAMLYEMVTGQRAFAGQSRASLIAAILDHDPPPVSTIQPLSPASLDHVVTTCLAKDPDDRWQSAHDVMAELQWITGGVVEARGDASPAGPGWKGQRLALSGLCAALLAGLVWTLAKAPGPRAAPGPVVRAALPLAAGEMMTYAGGLPLGIGRPSLALSPDGSKAAYVVEEGESTRIHLRGLAEADATPLGGTEGGFDPFFSPDGRWLAFFSADALKKVSLQGGEPVTLCEAPNPLGGTWGEDDTIFFSPRLGAELTRVAVAGGEAETVWIADSSKRMWPQLLPGGEAVLLTEGSRGNPDFSSLVAFFPGSGETRLLLEGGSFARYVPTGHLLFVRGGAVHAVPFDPDRVEVTGASTLVLDGVRVEGEGGAAQLGYSLDGTLVYAPGGAMNVTELVWVDRGGMVEPLAFPPRPFGTFRLSPDNRRLAVVVYDRQPVVWIYDLERRTRHKLAPESDSSFPIWAPDGTRLAFESRRDGRQRVYWKSADGSDADERVAPNDERNQTPTSWASDGRTLAISAAATGGSRGIWLITLDDEREVQPFIDTPATAWGGSISPDDRWLAYSSDVSGRFEVYVQPFPAGGRITTVSTDGGEEPLWSPRGDELFYRNGNRLMAVAVGPGSPFSAGTPQEVFRRSFPNIPGRSYDVGPDARRFLVLRNVAGSDDPRQPQLVLNWFEELKARMRDASPAKEQASP